eukprot:3261043-Rhodomonas_salina.2
MERHTEIARYQKKSETETRVRGHAVPVRGSRHRTTRRPKRRTKGGVHTRDEQEVDHKAPGSTKMSVIVGHRTARALACRGTDPARTRFLLGLHVCHDNTGQSQKQRPLRRDERAVRRDETWTKREKRDR